jgi:hypothetical protein
MPLCFGAHRRVEPVAAVRSAGAEEHIAQDFADRSADITS